MSSTLVGLPFGLSAVWRWAWVDTGDYLGGRFDVGRALLVCGLVVAVVLVLEAPTVLLVWAQRSRLRQVDPVVGLWLTGAVIAALPGFRFVVHYFQLLVPPLALLGGVLLSGTGDRSRRIVLASAGVIAVLCMRRRGCRSPMLGRSNLIRSRRSSNTPADPTASWCGEHSRRPTGGPVDCRLPDSSRSAT